MTEASLLKAEISRLKEVIIFIRDCPRLRLPLDVRHVIDINLEQPLVLESIDDDRT